MPYGSNWIDEDNAHHIVNSRDKGVTKRGFIFGKHIVEGDNSLPARP